MGRERGAERRAGVGEVVHVESVCELGNRVELYDSCEVFEHALRAKQMRCLLLHLVEGRTQIWTVSRDKVGQLRKGGDVLGNDLHRGCHKCEQR